jgi:DNA-binding transcriptional ArsR family regulator
MVYSKHDFDRLARNMDAQSCRLFMLMFGKSDSNGIVSKDVSLNSLHLETNIAISTLSKTTKKLKEAGIVHVEYEVGVRTIYKLLPSKYWKI